MWSVKPIMLVVYNPMNNMVQLWENRNLLSDRMSSLFFHRYSVFSSTVNAVASGKVCIPQGTNQWVEMLELLNSFAFSLSTPPWPQEKNLCFFSFHSTKPGLVLPFFSLQLPSVSPVLAFKKPSPSFSYSTCCITHGILAVVAPITWRMEGL